MDLSSDEGLPPFADPWALIAEEAAALLPPRRVTPSEAAARFREVHHDTYSGPWSNDTAAYMVEPMNCTARPEYEAVVFCGPAQSLKTDGLIINKIVHTVTCRPMDTRVVQMDEPSARRFGKFRLDRLKRESPEYAARLLKGRHTDNTFDKQFVGMLLTVAYPTVNNLSSDSIAQMLGTDYDRWDDNIDGEGSGFDLMRQRTKTYGARGVTVAESSPGRDLTNPLWTPKTAHEAPPVSGILGLYNMGDRRRWHWMCPQCGHAFEPTFARLAYPTEDVTPAEAAKAVTMPCPDCGFPIEPGMKRELNIAARDGRGGWLREGEYLTPEGERLGTPLGSSIASFWLRGPAAAFQDWGTMVERYLSGVDAYERSGDESALRTTVNTDQAEPYMPRAIAAKMQNGVLTAEGLKEGAEDYAVGMVPADALFLVVTIDGQASRFVAQVTAFGRHLESWVIDRFDVVTPPSGEERLLDPAKRLEDWEALTAAVLNKAWPVSGEAGIVMRPRLVLFDTNGPAGYTGQAYDWWRAKKRQHGTRLLGLRGVPGWKVPRVALTYPDSERKDRNAGARGEVPVLQVASDRLKDMVDAGLRRTEDGPYRIHLSRHLPAQLFDELVAEVRGEKGWEKVAARNEALDLAYYAYAAALHLKADETDWTNASRWPVYMRREGNPYLIEVATDTATAATAAAPAVPAAVTVEGAPDDANARAQRLLAAMTKGQT